MTDAPDVLWGLQHGKERSVELLRHWPIDAAEAAATLRLIAADLEWLAASTPALLAPLSGRP